jgi:hypothetical protein
VAAGASVNNGHVERNEDSLVTKRLQGLLSPMAGTGQLIWKMESELQQAHKENKVQRVHLTLAISDYDHVRDFTQGDIDAEGIEITYLKLQHEEIFHRFIYFREWDVSEISMAKYVSLISRNDEDLTAIPVFPSRIFRLSSIRAPG